MGQARRLLSLWVLTVVFTAVVAGCGSSDETAQSTASGDGTTSASPAGSRAVPCKDVTTSLDRVRVSGGGCALAHGVVTAWAEKQSCRADPGASRTSCSVEAYQCLGAATEQGLAVTCATTGRSISFIAKR
jgi:hypothetical protein